MSDKAPTIRIACLEQFSGRNIGDTISLLALMDRIRLRVPQVAFDIYTYLGGDRNFPNTDHNVRFIDLMPWRLTLNYLGLPTLLNIPKADWVLTRGGRFFSYKLWHPYYNHMSSFRFLFPLIKRLGKPILLWDIGIGPFDNVISRKWAKKILSTADMISTRDDDSQTWLEYLNVKPKFQVRSADPVWLVDFPRESSLDELKRFGAYVERPYAVLSVTSLLDHFPGGKVTKSQLHSAVEAAIRILRTELLVWLVPTQISDIDFSRSLIKGETGVHLLPSHNISPQALIAFLGRARLTVGMRYHSLIMAMVGGCPTIAIGYAPKVVDLMHQMNMDEWCIQGNHLEDLPSRTRLAMNHLGKISEKQSLSIPILQQRAKLSDDCFDRFVTSRGL